MGSGRCGIAMKENMKRDKYSQSTQEQKMAVKNQTYVIETAGRRWCEVFKVKPQGTSLCLDLQDIQTRRPRKEKISTS